MRSGALVAIAFVVACGGSDERLPIDARSGDVDAALVDAALVDAALIDAPWVACPPSDIECTGVSSTFSCGGHCWTRCADTVTLATAGTRCTTWGGYLGEIDDQAENDCVAAAIPSVATWFGMQQLSFATDPDVGWTWNGDLDPPAYVHWTAGQPDDGDGNESANEQCAYFGATGTWDDSPSGSLFAFTCRSDP